MLTKEDRAAIVRFRGLYSGGAAQQLRDAGEKLAMPPWAETYWLGKQLVKCPMDLWVYQELIVERQPDVILETGTSGGGSAFFFATICDLIDHGHIVTVDTVPYPQLYKNHPRITYLAGDSVSELILAAMRRHLGPRCSVMVSLDSAHTYEHVGRELAAYGPLGAIRDFSGRLRGF